MHIGARTGGDTWWWAGIYVCSYLSSHRVSLPLSSTKLHLLVAGAFVSNLLSWLWNGRKLKPMSVSFVDTLTITARCHAMSWWHDGVCDCAGCSENICSGWDVGVGLRLSSSVGTWCRWHRHQVSAAEAFQCARPAGAQSFSGISIAIILCILTGCCRCCLLLLWWASQALPIWEAYAQKGLGITTN